MKLVVIIVCFLATNICYAQRTDTLSPSLKRTPGFARFITTVDLRQATKDGFYLNGYVVNLNYEQARQLDGKTVRISGKPTRVKANKQVKKGKAIQGRSEDAWHILKPKVEVLSN